MITAAALLAERVGDVLALSGFYETEPWGFQSENTFLNAALQLDTSLSPLELLKATQEIEIEMGRTQKSNGAYHDRIIDIDIPPESLFRQLLLSRMKTWSCKLRS